MYSSVRVNKAHACDEKGRNMWRFTIFLPASALEPRHYVSGWAFSDVSTSRLIPASAAGVPAPRRPSAIERSTAAVVASRRSSGAHAPPPQSPAFVAALVAALAATGASTARGSRRRFFARRTGQPAATAVASARGETVAVTGWVERFGRRGTEPNEQFRSEFGQNSFEIQDFSVESLKSSEKFNIF